MQTEFMFFFWMYGCCVEMHDASKDEAEKFYKYVYENVHNASTSDERENFLKESAAIGL